METGENFRVKTRTEFMMLLTYKLWIQLLFTTIFYKECHSHNSQKSLRNPSTLYILQEQDYFDPRQSSATTGHIG